MLSALHNMCVRLAKEAHVGIQGASGLTPVIVRTLDHLKRWRSAAALMLPVCLGFQEWATATTCGPFAWQKRHTQHGGADYQGPQGGANSSQDRHTRARVPFSQGSPA